MPLTDHSLHRWAFWGTATPGDCHNIEAHTKKSQRWPLDSPKQKEPAMTLSAKSWFFAVITTLAATIQPLFAAGHPGVGGGGGFSRPAPRPPVSVNRSLPARSPGSSQTLNPVGARNGVASS